MFKLHTFLKVSLSIMLFSVIGRAQFIDNFDDHNIDGWFYFTGDGNANMNFIPMDGFARILVDATQDKYNVWWAITKRDVSSYLDLSQLQDPSLELRVEARVRAGNAPRRVNMMVNTQRTTNFHIDLMEFEIPDTSNWYTISMTTNKLDAVPGDSLYVQMDFTDWGIGSYYIDVDYYRAEIINVNLAGPDKGELVPYHPAIPEINTFSKHLNVSQDAIINSDFPDVNFNDWHENDAQLLTVDATKWILLKWDLHEFANQKADGAGLLELTTYSVAKGGKYIETFGEDLGVEFGKIRIIEIFAGDPRWDQNKVTYNNFIQGKAYPEIFNTQMIYDLELSDEPGAKNFATISRPVMQRLLDGTTKGLLIRPLGAIDASFYASENNRDKNSPKLHFNVKK